MKFGVSTWLWTSPFKTETLALFPKIKRMGFDFVEVPIEDPALIDGKVVRRALDDHGLTCVGCGAFGPTRDLTHTDPKVHANCFDYIKRSLDLCGLAGGETRAQGAQGGGGLQGARAAGAGEDQHDGLGGGLVVEFTRHAAMVGQAKVGHEGARRQTAGRVRGGEGAQVQGSGGVLHPAERKGERKGGDNEGGGAKHGGEEWESPAGDQGPRAGLGLAQERSLPAGRGCLPRQE